MRLTVYAAGPQGKHTLMHAAALKHSPCMCRTNINCLCLCPLALHGELTPMSWRYGCLCSHTHPALAPGLLRSTHARSPVRPDFLLPRLSLPSINTHQSAPLPPLPDWLRQDLRLPAALAGQQHIHTFSHTSPIPPTRLAPARPAATCCPRWPTTCPPRRRGETSPHLAASPRALPRSWSCRPHASWQYRSTSRCG